MHLISCNWLPFYRPCSFASQTFIWFANFLMIALILCKKLILLYFNVLLCTRKKYRFNVQKQKKNSRYIYSNCSPTHNDYRLSHHFAEYQAHALMEPAVLQHLYLCLLHLMSVILPVSYQDAPVLSFPDVKSVPFTHIIFPQSHLHFQRLRCFPFIGLIKSST